MTEPRVLSDDDLEQLLRASFAAHESLADAETAHRLATTPPPPRRVWPAVVGVAAGVALIAGVGVGLARGHTSSPAVLHGAHAVTSNEAAPGSAPATAPFPALGEVNGVTGPGAGVEPAQEAKAANAANRRQTKLEAGLILASFERAISRMDGATTVGAPPDDFFKGGSANEVDNSDFSVTSYWSVPNSVWTVAERLESTRLDGAPGHNDAANTSADDAFAIVHYSWRSTEAYVDPWLFVTLQSDGDHTVARATVSIAPRRYRTAETYLSGDVTSVDVITQSNDGTKRYAVTDRTTVERLATAFQELQGSPAIKLSYALGCPMMLDPVSVTVVFHTANGDVRVKQKTVVCTKVLLTVFRDGHRLAPTLDDGDAGSSFARMVERAVGVGP